MIQRAVWGSKVAVVAKIGETGTWTHSSRLAVVVVVGVVSQWPSVSLNLAVQILVVSLLREEPHPPQAPWWHVRRQASSIPEVDVIDWSEEGDNEENLAEQVVGSELVSIALPH